MFKASPKASRAGWEHSAVGVPGIRSHATTVYQDPVTMDKMNAQLVQIQWTTVLLDLVKTLGGSDPLYEAEETLGTLFQTRVSFRLPLKKDTGIYEDIVAVGMKCFTAWEAESEASAAALSRLQWGPLRIRVLDTSNARCLQLEKRCHEVLCQAGKLMYAMKSVLSAWDDSMRKVEVCYMTLCQQASGFPAHKLNNTVSEVRADVADRLFGLNRAAYVKYVELVRDSEEVKTLLTETHEHVDSAFRVLPNAEACRYRGELPAEVKVQTKLILEEMMNSLGWAKPTFNIVCSDAGFYICEVSLVPKDCYGRVCGRTISVVGSEVSSETESVEVSCEAAIFFLEEDMTIYVVDLNYAARLHGKHYVCEAKDVVHNIRLIGSKVFAEWERMAMEIKSCGDYYKNLAMEHGGKRLRVEAEYPKPTHGVAVEELHTSCLASLQLADKRFNNVVQWIGVDKWISE